MERVKRLKVEQIKQAALELPQFLPTLITLLLFRQPVAVLERSPIQTGYWYPFHPPPPLFLRNQSFLI